MIFQQLIHIIKRVCKKLIFNLLTSLIVVYCSFSCPLYSQTNSHIKREFSDSITKKHQILVLIPQEEQFFLKTILKSSKTKIDYPEYLVLGEQILKKLEKTGYPFASVKLDSLEFENDTLFCQIKLDKSKYITYDSIILKGDLTLSKSYLQSYLQFKKGNGYNESDIQKISKRISELQYAIEIQPFGIEFVEEKANLYLFLNKRKINQFDGIVGFAPINQTTGKIGFTGELKLALVNTFKIGESVYLRWNAPETMSQLLDIETKFPYLFKTPFGADFSFQLDKKDTSYIKMNSNISVNYFFNGNNFLKTFIDYTTSNRLTTNENSSDSTFGNLTKTMYGIALYYKNLDFIFNPRKGVQLIVSASMGKNNTDLEISLSRYAIIGNGKGFIPIYKNIVGMIGLQSGFLLGKSLYKNEMFRLGGTNSIRGFDELSIYADQYVFGTLEIRYIMSKFSYFNLFWDGGWYQQNIGDQILSDTPYGFGIGIAFETKAGIFNLSYALGKQMNNPISLKTGKIHFGIAVQF